MHVNIVQIHLLLGRIWELIVSSNMVNLYWHLICISINHGTTLITSYTLIVIGLLIVGIFNFINKKITFLLITEFQVIVLKIAFATWFSLFSTCDWVNIFILFLLIILKLMAVHKILFRRRIYFYFILRLKVTCFIVWSDMRIWFLYIFLCIAMEKNLSKTLAWLRIGLVYWFGAKIIILLLFHLIHHSLEKRLVLRKLFDKGFYDSL